MGNNTEKNGSFKVFFLIFHQSEKAVVQKSHEREKCSALSHEEIRHSFLSGITCFTLKWHSSAKWKFGFSLPRIVHFPTLFLTRISYGRESRDWREERKKSIIAEIVQNPTKNLQRVRREKLSVYPTCERFSSVSPLSFSTEDETMLILAEAKENLHRNIQLLSILVTDESQVRKALENSFLRQKKEEKSELWSSLMIWRSSRCICTMWKLKV